MSWGVKVNVFRLIFFLEFHDREKFKTHDKHTALTLLPTFNFERAVCKTETIYKSSDVKLCALKAAGL